MYIGLHTPLIANHSSTIFKSICPQVKLFKMHSNNMDIIFHSGHPYHFSNKSDLNAEIPSAA